jgi:hypothetical protein
MRARGSFRCFYFLPWKRTRDQGDQIGRIFAYWAIVYFGQFIENYGSSPDFCAPFSHGNCAKLNLEKLVLATFWAIFFTNSSGHPARGASFVAEIKFNCDRRTFDLKWTPAWSRRR